MSSVVEVSAHRAPWSVFQEVPGAPFRILARTEHGPGAIASTLRRADALLMATAPDLLALARDLLLDHQTVEPHHHDTCETCRRANAIIARAEGRSDE